MQWRITVREHLQQPHEKSVVFLHANQSILEAAGDFINIDVFQQRQHPQLHTRNYFASLKSFELFIWRQHSNNPNYLNTNWHRKIRNTGNIIVEGGRCFAEAGKISNTTRPWWNIEPEQHLRPTRLCHVAKFINFHGKTPVQHVKKGTFSRNKKALGGSRYQGKCSMLRFIEKKLFAIMTLLNHIKWGF